MTPRTRSSSCYDADGSVVAVTDNATGLSAAARPLRPGANQVVATVSDVPLSNGDFRVLARSLVGTASGPTTLVVAKNLDDVNESVSILKRSLAVAIPVVTGLLALLVWWLTGRVLRPVESIRREVASIEGHGGHRRVPTPGSEDEIARLASTMNEMLDRVQEATDRQRRFVADASHELRGPLTRLRSSLEVTIAHPDGVDAVSLSRELLGDTVELQKLVDDLLFLARSESGSLEVPHQPVDLDDLVLEEARRVRDSGSVRVDVSAVSAARTWGSANQLARAVRNLSSNAERHAERCVTFELPRGRRPARQLVVVDDGPGVAPKNTCSWSSRGSPISTRPGPRTRAAPASAWRSSGTSSRSPGASTTCSSASGPRRTSRSRSGPPTRASGTVGLVEHAGPGARFVVDLPRAE